MIGDEVDLFKFPVPIWSPDKDAGPYLTAPLVITKDPETGIQNVGTYRCHIQEKNRIGINIHRERHGGFHITKWEELNEPMDIAICLGSEPTVPIASVGPVPYGTDEVAVCGALKGRAVEVVKGETVDLMIPATTEIVIEGKIYPKSVVSEAPFGEFTGYMGGNRLSPRVDVTAITFRNKPIFHSFLSQRPPSESSMIRKAVNEPIMLEKLRAIGIPGIVDLSMSEASGSWFHGTVSIKKMYPGHAREVMTACWGVGSTFFRRITIVDDEINVRDPFEVEWAVATRCRPDKDIVIIPEHITTILDPVMTQDMQRDMPGGITAKYGIDATKSHEYNQIALPDEKYLKMAKEKFEKYGIKRLNQENFK
jgi:UbiD family decarboxylase